MEDNLRLRYNRISAERQALIKKAKKLYDDMKCIINEHNDNATTTTTIKYDLENPPDVIVIHRFDIKYLLSIPDDIFQHHFIQYLSIKDIGQFDKAVTNINHRSPYLEKIANNIIGNNKFYTMDRSALLWLKNKKLFLTNMSFKRFPNKSTIIEIHEIFRHCKGLDFTLTNRTSANILSLIISQCDKLKSLRIQESNNYSNVLVDNFSKYCTGLQTLDLKGCCSIRDESIISISKNCIRLQSLNLSLCDYISKESVISITKNCTGLQSLNLSRCNRITDESIISISKNCTGLQSLFLRYCSKITDAALIQVSIHCKELEYLDVLYCSNISQVLSKEYTSKIQLQEATSSL